MMRPGWLLLRHSERGYDGRTLRLRALPEYTHGIWGELFARWYAHQFSYGHHRGAGSMVRSDRAVCYYAAMAGAIDLPRRACSKRHVLSQRRGTAGERRYRGQRTHAIAYSGSRWLGIHGTNRATGGNPPVWRVVTGRDEHILCH